MGAQEGIEDLDEQEYRPHGKMLQGPVRDTVRSRSLAHLEAPDGFSNLIRVGQLWFAGRGLEVRLQRHVNRLNDGRDQRNGDRLKLSLQTVGEGFCFLRGSPQLMYVDGRYVRNLMGVLAVLQIVFCEVKRLKFKMTVCGSDYQQRTCCHHHVTVSGAHLLLLSAVFLQL